MKLFKDSTDSLMSGWIAALTNILPLILASMQNQIGGTCLLIPGMSIISCSTVIQIPNPHSNHIVYLEGSRTIELSCGSVR